MGKGRFLNQKLGKRISRKLDLLKSRLAVQQILNPSPSADRLPKKGVSRRSRSA